jgi:hypothetical protein
MRSSLVVVVLSCAALASCESYTAVPSPTTYAATLAPSAVRPTQAESDGVGVFGATHRHVEQRLEFLVAWKDLGSAVTEVHLHGPADENAVGSVLVDFAALPAEQVTFGTDPVADTVIGRLLMTGDITPTVSADSLRKLLNAGRTYIDVHTADLPGGEVRGQVRRTN